MEPNPPDMAPAAESLQSMLSGYDQIEMIALGGMGAVYRARQVSLDRPVAIKVLTHACASSPQFREIFQAEAKVMAKLNHPNLVSIYDYGDVQGMLFIVMEFVEGRSLYEAAHGQVVKQEEAAKLVSTLAKSLSHAHHAGILHRDIKPANILIDANVRPVIVDFGLAHQSDESTAKGETVFGTPGYTAPEVLTPPYRADQRADIFALGVLLHELLTGETPRTPYIPPSQLAPVDPRYDAVVTRAIQPQAALRHSLAEELASDLDTILSGKELRATSLLLTPLAPGKTSPSPTLQSPFAPTTYAPEHPAPSLPTAVTPLPSPSSADQTSSSSKPALTAIAATVAAALVISSLVTLGAEDESPRETEPHSVDQEKFIPDDTAQASTHSPQD
ncbi:MAG: serine/threonine-protein kinase [Akkermansiaceae bacterium]